MFSNTFIRFIRSPFSLLCLLLLFSALAFSAPLSISFKKGESKPLLVPAEIREKAENITRYLSSNQYLLQTSLVENLKAFWEEVDTEQQKLHRWWNFTDADIKELNDLAFLPFYMEAALDSTSLRYFRDTGMPESTINRNHIQLLKSQLLWPLVTPKGLIIGFAPYEQLDPLWLIPRLDYFAQLIGLLKVEPFNDTPAIVDHAVSQESLKIIMIGDWGTDTENARATMAAAAKHQPDYVIHLGDVYYSGSESEEKYIYLKNFIGGSKGSLMLNSNHEMDGAGKGYFRVALKDDLFEIQNQSSFFVINYNNWAIIGLDSAYDAEKLFYSDGRIKRSSQLDLIQSQYNQGKRIIILTHHNPMSVTGEELNPLWTDVTSAMNHHAPEYWYYGHQHVGISYSDLSAAGQLGTHARCAGHGGIPTGTGSDYFKHGTDELLDTIDYYSHTPHVYPPYQILNGYLLLTIDNGVVSDHFFEQ